MRPDRLLERVRGGALHNVAFRDFLRLLESLGFRHARTRGSHLTYEHAGIRDVITVQPIHGNAKPYQIRDLLGILAEYPEIEREARFR